MPSPSPCDAPVLSRRAVMIGAGAVTAAAAFATPHLARAQAPAPLSLMALPYADTALAPVVSQLSIGFHYGKHHAGYVAAANKALETDATLRGRPLAELVKAAAQDPAKTALFNAAAQIWNHDFYWNSLSPQGGGKPTGKLAALIDASFGGYDGFKAGLTQAAMTQFGSGWAWLCLENGKLTLRKTSNADTPLTAAGVTPLLTIDVWEHAYYLDYQNRRADYVAAVIDKLLNWSFAERNLG